MAECVYQGSFNPIHNAHLAVAQHAYEQFGFEKIVFIPAFKPPHKSKLDFDMDNAMHRLEMVQLAVQDYPYFDVSAIEYMRNETSYTYDTIMQIYQIVQPTEKINFIICFAYGSAFVLCRLRVRTPMAASHLHTGKNMSIM